jgi:hypothetical protein
MLPTKLLLDLCDMISKSSEKPGVVSIEILVIKAGFIDYEPGLFVLRVRQVRGCNSLWLCLLFG